MAAQREQFVTLGEAQERLGVSRFKITQLIKEKKLVVFQSEIDRREKLVRVSDLERLREPRMIDDEIDDEGKAAA